jgi:hypothetical protein
MKKYILIFLVSLSFIAFTGCEQGLDAKITDYNYVAFSAVEADLKVDKGSSNSATYQVAVSQASSSERTFNIVVDQAMTDADPASYTLPSSITIPANKTVADLKIDVVDVNIISSKTLVIKLEEKEGILIGNDNQFVINLLRICVSDIAGNYAYASNGKPATVTKTGEGKYTVSGDDYFGSDYSFDISDGCDILKVTGGFLDVTYGIAVSGEGMVMANGNLEITYSAAGYFADRVMVLEKQ